MMKRFVFAGAAIACFATAGQAQYQRPVLGPEHKRLEYFLGDWKTEGDVKPGPYGPAGKFTSTDHGELLDGGFFVVTRANSTTPTGKQVQVSVIGYDAAQKTYTFNSYNSAGMRTASVGTFAGDTWTWTSDTPMGQGRMFSVRYTIKVISPTEYTFKFEMSTDQTIWSLYMEGRATKTA